MNTNKQKHNIFGAKLFSPIDVLSDEHTLQLFTIKLRHMFTVIGCSSDDSINLQQLICKEMATKASILAIENEIRKIMDGHYINEIRRNAIVARALKIVGQISPFIIGNKILDLGCGNGLISNNLKNDIQASFTLCDIANYVYNEVTLPFILIDEGGVLPFQNKEYDSSLVLTVLHHSSNPLQLLAEAIRVTKHRLIIIETVYSVNRDDVAGNNHRIVDFTTQIGLQEFLDLSSEQQRIYATAMDWFYNRVLEGDVVLTDNFNTIHNWDSLIVERGLSIVVKEILGFDQPTAPEFHVLYVIEVGAI